MTFANVFFAGALILSFAILLASFNSAESQQQQRRPVSYMIASSGNSSFVWRVNTSTGGVSYCVRLNSSTSEDFVARQRPFCSASSKPTRSGQ